MTKGRRAKRYSDEQIVQRALVKKCVISVRRRNPLSSPKQRSPAIAMSAAGLLVTPHRDGGTRTRDPLNPIRGRGKPNNVNLPGFKNFRASVPGFIVMRAGLCL